MPESWAQLCWQKLKIVLTPEARLTVTWKGKTILDAFQTSFFPSAGSIVLAGRTGGANEHTHFDNIHLVTTAAAADNTAPSVPDGLAISGVSTRVAAIKWNAATDDSGKVAYEIERDGAPLTTSVITATSYTDTTVQPNTSYNYKVRATDPSGNKSALSAALAVKTEVETLTATTGFLKFETWSGITGTPVDGLADPRYPTARLRFLRQFRRLRAASPDDITRIMAAG